MRIKLLIFYIFFVSVCAFSFECDAIDTLFRNSDTLVTKYRCYDNGNKKKIIRYRNGKYDGLKEVWHKNGKKMSEIPYLNNKKNGIVKGWNEVGDLVSHYEFRNGIPVGFHKSYYSKNRPKEFTHYNDSGEKHGLCETWFENGNRKDSVVYNNGKIVEGRYYFRNGKLRYTAKLKNGDIVKAVYFSPDGEKTGEIINGNGTVLIYDVDGISPSEFKCKNGKWVD